MQMIRSLRVPRLVPAAIGAFKVYRCSNDDIELKEETESDADVAVRLPRDALGADPVVALLRWEAPGQVVRLEMLFAEEVVDVLHVPKALRALQATLSFVKPGPAYDPCAARFGRGDGPCGAGRRGASSP